MFRVLLPEHYLTIKFPQIKVFFSLMFNIIDTPPTKINIKYKFHYYRLQFLCTMSIIYEDIHTG